MSSSSSYNFSIIIYILNREGIRGKLKLPFDVSKRNKILVFAQVRIGLPTSFFSIFFFFF